jgi:hypothetical protein
MTESTEVRVTDEMRRVWEAGFDDGRMKTWDDAVAGRDSTILAALRAADRSE